MNERALMGTVFAAGVLTAVVAGLAGWQLGRPRPALPTVSGTQLPPDSHAPGGRPAPPASDAASAPPALSQRPADRQPAALRAMNLPAETAAAAALARSLARPADQVTDRHAAAPPAGRPPDPRPAPRGSEAPDRRALAVLRPVDLAPAAPATVARAVRPAESAETPRLATLTGSVADAQRSSALPAERPATAMLAAPSPVEPDRVRSGLPGSAAPPILSAEPAVAAVPAPAPALQAPAAAPFVASLTMPSPGEAHAGAAADPTGGRRASRPVPAMPAGASVAAAPIAPPVAAPRAPVAISGPAAGPSLAIGAPAEPEVTAAIPPVVGSDQMPALGSARPGRAGSPDRRRRLTVVTPSGHDLRAPAETRRASRAARRLVRRSVVDGGMRPRSPVTIVYGTVPPAEFGPVLIRIHGAGRGRARVSRIPLD